MDGGDQQDELIAAETRHRVDGPHQSGQAAGHFLQQLIARMMPQGVVHQLESIEVAYQQGEGSAVAIGVRHRLGEPVVEQHAVWKSRERIVSGQMPQLAVRGFQSPRSQRDHLLEAFHLIAHQALVLPLSSQRGRTLQHFDGFGGFAQHQQLVRVLQAVHDLGPIVVGVRGADHHLHVGIRRP